MSWVLSQLWEPPPGRCDRSVSWIKKNFWILKKTDRRPEILNSEFANSNLVNRSFNLTPRTAEYFVDVSNGLQTDPSSLFVTKLICSLQMPTGFRALIGWTYSEVTFQGDLMDVPGEQIESLLRDKFNICLPNKLQPVNNHFKYTL